MKNEKAATVAGIATEDDAKRSKARFTRFRLPRTTTQAVTKAIVTATVALSTETTNVRQSPPQNCESCMTFR